MSIRATVKVNSQLSDIERRFAIPLVEIAQQLVPGMVGRIAQGVSSTGTFAPLGAYSIERPGNGLFWVPPGNPQPAGYVVQPKAGAYGGWAGYRSYKEYTSALGGGPRTFTLTGMLLRSLAIRVLGPGRVKVAFYGGHKPSRQPTGKTERKSNANVAFLASRQEPAAMLTPTRREVEQVARQLQSEVAAQVVGQASDAQSIRQLGQRATRLAKRLPASVGAR